MARTRSRFAERLTLVLMLAGLPPGFAEGGPPLADTPVIWHVDDRRPIEKPEERDPSLLWDVTEENVLRPIGRVFHPGRLVRKVGTVFGGDHVPPAANLNRLDEVPNSTWFTNRIGLFPMTPDEIALGPGTGEPDASGPWTVIRAKTQGVTPGFTIRDARGDAYLIKFDPPRFPGTSAAAVISGKILHACGYNVPEDAVVDLRRDNLVVGEGVKITLSDGTRRIMTAEDLTALLDSVAVGDGPIRAIASKYLDGEPVGPFDWLRRRKDDPNDRVDHEERRELRALRVIAAWLNHFDMKQLNTLDMYVEDGDRRYVKHHLIDFASTLGAGASGPRASFGFEYSFDGLAILGRTAALGLHESPWRRLQRPDGLDEIGYFEGTEYRPEKFKPQYPNSAFANLTDRDGYWASKIVSSFTDEHLEAAVAAGRYRNPAAARTMVQMLAERRDLTARHWFDRIPPLDFFRFDGSTLAFHDLGEERGLYPGTTPEYRFRVSAASADRKTAGWTDWIGSGVPRADLAGLIDDSPVSEYPFAAVRLQVRRDAAWSATVTVYLSRASHRVVALER